jgi:hypothetical protein
VLDRFVPFARRLLANTVLVALAFFSFSIDANGQREFDWNYETWWGLMTSTRVAERLSVYNDFHYSNNLFVAYRTGLTYHPKKDNFVTTVAYAYLKLTAPFSEGSLVRSEHRPWMQVVYRVPSTKRLSTSFRFKYDMRFIRDLLPESLADSYSLNHRWRFNNALRYHFNANLESNTPVFGVLLNEALITTGPGPNGVFYEHRTHLMGEVRRGKFIYSAGCMVRYLGVSPELARMTVGPVIWVTINLNFLRFKSTGFTENPEDHTD